MGKLGLVLSGGGARGAYEAGVMHFIRTGLPKKYALKSFQIQCGTSAGAINTAGIAAFAHDPLKQGRIIKELWLNIRQEDVYRRDFSAMAHFVSYSLRGIFRRFTTLDPLRLIQKEGTHFRSLLDNTPLWNYLQKSVPFDQIKKNVKDGPVDAVSVAVTHTRSGRPEIFVTKKDSVPSHGDYRYHKVDLTLEHVMASAAIPIIFQTIKIGDAYYTDGSLRLFTPLSPAIQMGADRIVIVGLRHQATEKELEAYDSEKMKAPPSLSELLGKLMNHLFLDRIQYDLEQVDRINRIIEWSETIYGSDYLEKMNAIIKKSDLKSDITRRGLQKIRTVEIFPSEFVSDLFSRWFTKQNKKTFEFSPMEKLLTRVLDIDAPGAKELLSYLIFAKEYLAELIDLGYEDAKKQQHRLMDLLED